MLERLMRYGVVGLAGTALYFLTVLLLVEGFAVDPVASAAAAVLLVVLFNYVLNRGWVFRSDRRHRSAFPRFLLIAAVSMALNVAIMHLTVHVLGWWYVTGLVLATLVVPPTNFLLNHWCFR